MIGRKEEHDNCPAGRGAAAIIRLPGGNGIAMTGMAMKNQRSRRTRGQYASHPQPLRSGSLHGSWQRKIALSALAVFFGFAIIAVPAGSLHAQSRAARAKTDEADPPKIDPIMEQAFGMARASLDQFLELARFPPPHLRGFSLKVGITEEPDLVEYFWINDFSQSGNSFSGKINNRPLLVKNVRRGRVHQFRREDIVDWTYIDMDTRKIHGNFTACALLVRKPPDLADELRDKFGLICDI